jgi:hypothetical protein
MDSSLTLNIKIRSSKPIHELSFPQHYPDRRFIQNIFFLFFSRYRSEFPTLDVMLYCHDSVTRSSFFEMIRIT